MKLLILSLLFAVALAERARYDGYQTVRLQPLDKTQQEYVHHLTETLDERYDVWAHSKSGPTDIMMPPNLVAGFKLLLDAKDIEYSIMVDDVQALIDAENKPSAPVANAINFDYSVYHPWNEIQAWTTEMANAYSIATRIVVATTLEGRTVHGLRISTGPGINKRTVYWQGGIHAREWISPATVMYMTQQMVDNSGGDFAPYFDAFDFIIVPSLNIDGYAWSWSDDRMWRKNRNPNGGGCHGVDGNRNYDMQWGGSGSSGVECSDTYRGVAPHSEPMVSDSTNYLMGLTDNIVSFIDFHSYGQYWLSPWSYSTIAPLPAESDDQIAAANAGAAALQAVHGTVYEVGPSAVVLYEAAGCSEDWAFDTLGAKFSYVVELRDQGQFGFILPAIQIIPTGQETYAGAKGYLQWIIDNN